jgi:hypothetical protein
MNSAIDQTFLGVPSPYSSQEQWILLATMIALIKANEEVTFE